MNGYEQLTETVFGIRGESTPLPGEIDDNRRLVGTDGRAYLLRISPSNQDPAMLSFRQSAITALGDCPIDTPQVVQTLDGDSWATLDDGRFVHLYTWVEGTPFSELSRPAELARQIGVVAGTVVNALAGLASGPRPDRFLWDVTDAVRIVGERASMVTDPLRRRLIDGVLLRIAGINYGALPRQVLHNDLNDEHLIVRDGVVAGVIDFGDAVHTVRVADLAIASTYAMLDQDDPVSVAADVIVGYRSVAPIEEVEADVILDFILARLATSVTVSAARGGSNPHHMLTEDMAWDLLERLMLGDVDGIAAELTTAAGYPREPGRVTADLLDQRSILGPSLGLSYAEPLNIVRGSGAFLYDERGRRYLDCVNNVSHVGHGNRVVAAAAADQMRVLNTNTRYLHADIFRYAERLLATLPGHLDRVFLVNSGSEANELAIRLVRTATERRDIVCLDHGYHGNTSTLIDVSPYKFNAPGGRGQADWVHVLPSPDPYRVPEFGGAGAAERYRGLAYAILEGTEPAGLIAETLPGCGGQVIPAPGVLDAAYEAVRARGGLVIADEVQTGFGRTGICWSFQRYGLEPDVVTMGKPAGNGHPLAAVVTTRSIAGQFDNGMEYFNTFGGNPVSVAVGNAVFAEMDRLNVVHHGAVLGDYLLASLKALAGRHDGIGDVRGAGLYLGVELVVDRASKQPAPARARAVVEHAKTQGVLLSTDGPFANVIKIKPPMVFGTKDADRLVAVLDQALTAVAG